MVRASWATMQAAGHSSRTDRGGARATAFLQDVVHVGRRQMPRRHEPDPEARNQARGAEEHPGHRVGRQIHPIRHYRAARRTDLDDVERLRHLARAEDRQPQAEGAGERGDHPALDQQLPDDPPSRRAEPRANRHLARAVASSGRATSWRRWRRQSAGRTPPRPSASRESRCLPDGVGAVLQGVPRSPLQRLVACSGWLLGNRAAMVCSSARACSRSTPSASRPKTLRLRRSRLGSAQSRSRARWLPDLRRIGNANRGGITPMTVDGTPLTRTPCPTIAGSPP